MSATSNFAFLQPDWPELLAEARLARAALGALLTSLQRALA